MRKFRRTLHFFGCENKALITSIWCLLWIRPQKWDQILYFNGQHSKTLCTTSGTSRGLYSNGTGLISLHYFCAITEHFCLLFSFLTNISDLHKTQMGWKWGEEIFLLWNANSSSEALLCWFWTIMNGNISSHSCWIILPLPAFSYQQIRAGVYSLVGSKQKNKSILVLVRKEIGGFIQIY